MDYRGSPRGTCPGPPPSLHPHPPPAPHPGRRTPAAGRIYAPWTNPIEKGWRKLKGEAPHQHAFAADWPGLKATAEAWLATDPATLKRYTGLGPADESGRLCTTDLSKIITGLKQPG